MEKNIVVVQERKYLREKVAWTIAVTEIQLLLQPHSYSPGILDIPLLERRYQLSRTGT